jgi:hypothetical protein
MNTRSGSDKEEVDNLYRSAIENQGIPGRSKNEIIHTSTPTVSSKPTPKIIDFSSKDSENPSEDIDDTLELDSDDSGDVTVTLKNNEPPPKYKVPRKMTNPNPFAPLKYAVEAVPFFDGQNIPLSYFIEGCEEAKSMLPGEAEP